MDLINARCSADADHLSHASCTWKIQKSSQDQRLEQDDQQLNEHQQQLEQQESCSL